MDPRRQNALNRGRGFVEASRGRGRNGLSRGRGFVNPQPMSQPYYPQQSPQPYYPQPASSQPMYYTETPRMNIRDYEFVKTAEFEPFFPQPASSQPLYQAYRDKLPSDDDEESVPETQEVANDNVQEVQLEDVQTVQPRKFKRRADKKPWSQEEEVALAKAWIHISTCRVIGNEQGRDKFWERILEHFSSILGGTTRTHHSLNTKWSTMNGAMNTFNGLYHQSFRMWQSGCTDLDVLQNALADYDTKVGKPFTHQLAWNVVKDEAKWKQHKTTQATQQKATQSCQSTQDSSTSSDKRRKSSDGGNYASSSNDPDTIIPDLNENNTPTRQRKGKKPVSETSSAATIVDSVQLYADEKKKMMAEITEKTKAILDLQFQQQKEKSERDDYKFFKKPHDDEKDPVVLEWVLNKKRHIAKTYNWPFDG